MIIDELDKIKNKQIILDSCVLIYCEGYDFKLEIRNILRKLTDNNNELGISELSVFEVLRRAKTENKKYFVQLLNYLNNIPVSKGIINNSIILYNTYKHNGFIKGSEKEDGKRDWTADLIIGGTALYQKDSLILTANRRDFPEPVWKAVVNFPMIHKLNDRFELINFYLLSPTRTLVN
jgi:predicted nucleic acid-binding protein